MAVQSQMYSESSGFPMFRGGGGGVAVALHDDQMPKLPFQSLAPNWRTTQYLNVDDTATFSASVAGKQGFEIDQFILSQVRVCYVFVHPILTLAVFFWSGLILVLVKQTERLSLILREQTKRQISELQRKIETRASDFLNQKDEEIARALNRTSQLDSLLAKLQSENLTWQQIAEQNELHSITLLNTVQQLQQTAAVDVGQAGARYNYNNAAAVEDTESCCDGQQSGLNSGTRRVCKACCTREINVVLLPCRHLCCCTICESVINFCPVCQTEKKGSIEALFS
ncbi:unnamed protein product [Rhodiola kirilowii]